MIKSLITSLKLSPSKKTARGCVIEQVEPRQLMSVAPIPSQVPPPIIWKNYDNGGHTHKVSKPEQPTPTPSPVQTPVQPPVQKPVEPQPVSPVVLPATPKGLKARPCPKYGAIALCWKKVTQPADTVVVEVSTDGQHFTTLAMLDADQKKFVAKNLDKTNTYTFRIYSLVGTVASAHSDEVTVKWTCKK